jgi:4-hydroxy-2-oxoheptanedioate aldolase
VAKSHFDLKARLARPEPFHFTWMTVPSPELAGQAARLPIEGVCLDMQHGLIGFPIAASMIAAINAAGRPALVRALWNDPGIIGQALDAGAACVIAPMINSRSEAEALVRFAKYPPIGRRSWGGYTAVQTAGLTAPEYLKRANSLTQVFAMVETVAALEQVDQIAATPGLDGLFVGPSDLSIALSNGAKIDRMAPKTIEAMKRIAKAARKSGLVAGAFGGSAEIIKAYRKIGYTFFAAATDVDLMQSGASELAKALKRV